MFNQAPMPSSEQQDRARRGQSAARAGTPAQQQMGGDEEDPVGGIGAHPMDHFGMHHAMTQFGPTGMRAAALGMAMGGAPSMPGGRMMMRGPQFAPSIRHMGRAPMTRAFGSAMPIKEPGMADGGDASAVGPYTWDRWGNPSTIGGYAEGADPALIAQSMASPKPLYGDGSGELGPPTQGAGGTEDSGPGVTGGAGFFYGPNGARVPNNFGGNDAGSPVRGIGFGGDAMGGGMSGLMGDYFGGSPRNSGGQRGGIGGYGQGDYSAYGGGAGGYSGDASGFPGFTPYGGDFYHYGESPGWNFFGGPKQGGGQGPGGGQPGDGGDPGYGRGYGGADATGGTANMGDFSGMHSSYDQYNGFSPSGAAWGAAKGAFGGPLGMFIGGLGGGLWGGRQGDMDPGSYGPMSGEHGNPEVGGAAHGGERGPAGPSGGDPDPGDNGGGPYADGGFRGVSRSAIKGPGDGRSDSIPAELSDGEHVIPADVVSGIGNGSSDAGHRVLNAMILARRKKYGKHLGKLPPPKE